MAEHALAHAAEVALHGVLHVAQVVPPKAPVAASLPALPPVYPCRCLRDVVICRQAGCSCREVCWSCQGCKVGSSAALPPHREEL